MHVIILKIMASLVCSTVNVGNYFSLKDSTNRNFSSCQVYRFTCPGDFDTHYTGETARQLFLRVKENNTQTNSSIFNHIKRFRYCQNSENIYDCFKVINLCKTHCNFFAVVAFLIKIYKHNLNNQLGSNEGS